MSTPITVVTQDINAGPQGSGAIVADIEVGEQSHKAVVRVINLGGSGGGDGGGGSPRPTTGMIYPRGQG